MYKILIVEDEVIIRKGLIFSIDYNQLNCSIIAEAGNGKEGIDLIVKHHPDIVITDINMPIMTGLEMIEKTYLNYDYSAIIISGYNEFEYAKKAIDFGIAQYILKPVNHEELIKSIKKCIKQIEMKKTYYKANENNENLFNKILIKTKNNLSLYTKEVINIIETNYMKKIQMQDCVKTLNVSQSFLHNKFKEETGLTFNDYLNRYRIQVAINHLKENKLPIYKISELTGFSDYKYFVKVFNKYTGVSPSEYKEIV